MAEGRLTSAPRLSGFLILVRYRSETESVMVLFRAPTGRLFADSAQGRQLVTEEVCVRPDFGQRAETWCQNITVKPPMKAGRPT